MTRIPALLALLALACSTPHEQNTGLEYCTEDGHCPAGQRCELEPIDRPTEGLIAYCSSHADCFGLLCVPGWQTSYAAHDSLVCASPCQETGCPEYALCGSDGVCELVLCDEPGAASCAQHLTCDPERASTASRAYAVGGAVPDPPALSLEMDRGCVRRLCDDPEAFGCHPAWTCSPAEATDPSGCVHLPCAETGHCANDTTQICAAARTVVHGESDVDEYGCSPRNCLEGGTCGPNDLWSVCDPGHPDADPNTGCVVVRCKTDDDCFGGGICDPASALSSERGCRFKPPGGLCVDT